MTGNLYEDQHTFVITALSVLVKIKNVSDTNCGEIKTFYVQ
jgi:hypothetical protein